MTATRPARGLLAALLSCASSLGVAHAHGGVDARQPDLRTLAAESPLVVWGEVADVVYRNSEPTKEEPKGVPHTFVTYKVREFIRGRTETGEVVLRFVGGADGRGGVYMETTTPVFARGQSDILFIKGGAQDDCPLVACVDGRFRVADGRVFNGWGVPVVEARKGLVIGGRPNLGLLTMELPRPPFEALAERPEMRAFLEQEFAGVSREELKKRYEAEAPERTVVGYEVSGDHGSKEDGEVSPPIRKFGDPLRIDEFLAAVKAAVAEAPQPKLKPTLADPKAPVVVAPPRATAFQASVVEIRRTPLEQSEIESLREGADLDGPVKPRPDRRIDPRPRIDPKGLREPLKTPTTPTDNGGEE